MRNRILWAALLLTLTGSPTLHAAKPRVSFELVMEKGFPFSEARKWSRMFSNARLTVTRIRGAKANDRTAISERGRGASKRYFVVGALTSRGRLDLPGTTIRYGDTAKLKRWISRLQDEGVEGIASVRGAFGLTGKQLLKANELLSTKVLSATKGRRCGDCAKEIIKTLGSRVTYGPGARAGLRSAEKMVDELKGLSSGTALAAALRPIGLALVPETKVGQVQFRIVAATKVKQTWPIGWPAKKSPARSMPVLFKFLNVRIDKIPLKNAMAAIQKRLGEPILYDHNRITLRRVDMDKRVSLAPKRTFYKRIIDRLLFQVKMKAEIRVDEANKAFLWVTTIRQ